MSKRTALLTREEKEYALFLFESEKHCKTITIQSEEDEIFAFTLKNRLGLPIEEATYSMVAKGSVLLPKASTDESGYESLMVGEGYEVTESEFDTTNNGIQQPPLLSESTIAALNKMAHGYVTKKRTIRLSDATPGAKTDLMDMLRLPEKGSSWPNEPSTLQRVSAHLWLKKGDEHSEENRLAYMAYLRTMLQIPGDYELADVQPERTLLSVEQFGGMTESRKI
eukprot:Sro94_g048920.1 n/a (224) ;mRNA; f:35930-36965